VPCNVLKIAWGSLAYESRNQEWKQGFRAGKKVTEISRSFVQKWLNELQVKK
jgi:hypothetical protein